MKTEYELRVRYGASDLREGGCFDEAALGRSDDEAGLRRLAGILNEEAKALMDAFQAGPSSRTSKDRFDSTRRQADAISGWSELCKVRNLTSPACFHVKEVPKIPVLDLSRLDDETEISA